MTGTQKYEQNHSMQESMDGTPLICTDQISGLTGCDSYRSFNQKGHLSNTRDSFTQQSRSQSFCINRKFSTDTVYK